MLPNIILKRGFERSDRAREQASRHFRHSVFGNQSFEGRRKVPGDARQHRQTAATTNFDSKKRVYPDAECEPELVSRDRKDQWPGTCHYGHKESPDRGWFRVDS